MVAVAFPVMIVWLAAPLVVRGLRTGELEARGRSYFRVQHPLRYWFGIVFWMALLAFSVFVSCLVFWGFVRGMIR
jgi:hypothetical protein